jgi:hypothetical protein
MFSAAIFYAGIVVEWGTGAPLFQSGCNSSQWKKEGRYAGGTGRKQAVFLVDEAQLRKKYR